MGFLAISNRFRFNTGTCLFRPSFENTYSVKRQRFRGRKKKERKERKKGQIAAERSRLRCRGTSWRAASGLPGSARSYDGADFNVVLQNGDRFVEGSENADQSDALRWTLFW